MSSQPPTNSNQTPVWVVPVALTCGILGVGCLFSLIIVIARMVWRRHQAKYAETTKTGKDRHVSSMIVQGPPAMSGENGKIILIGEFQQSEQSSDVEAGLGGPESSPTQVPDRVETVIQQSLSLTSSSSKTRPQSVSRSNLAMVRTKSKRSSLTQALAAASKRVLPEQSGPDTPGVVVERLAETFPGAVPQHGNIIGTNSVPVTRMPTLRTLPSGRRVSSIGLADVRANARRRSSEIAGQVVDHAISSYRQAVDAV